MMCSGGREGMNLALTLKQGANLLLLDEPTNDLDIETLGSLESAPAGVPRLRGHHQPRPLDFLDQVATHILAWKDDAELVLV